MAVLQAKLHTQGGPRRRPALAQEVLKGPGGSLGSVRIVRKASKQLERPLGFARGGPQLE